MLVFLDIEMSTLYNQIRLIRLLVRVFQRERLPTNCRKVHTMHVLRKSGGVVTPAQRTCTDSSQLTLNYKARKPNLQLFLLNLSRIRQTNGRRHCLRGRASLSMIAESN